MMAFQVRSMQLADLDTVYAIECLAYPAPWTREILEDCIKWDYDCRVLESDGKRLLGYIICRYQQDMYHILNICIMPRWQHRGYGEILLQTVLHSHHRPEIAFVGLEVRPSNVAALGLYTKMGFERVGIRKGYYDDESGVEDAILLRKSLKCA